MRTKRQRIEHQGRLTKLELKLVERMKELPPGVHMTTLTVCKTLKCVSARDRIRKLQAAGIKIGPAVLLRTNENGSRVYGWRMGK